MGYEETVALNDKLVSLVKLYRENPTRETLGMIFELLYPITKQQAIAVCNKLQMPADAVDDMIQEAFFKLVKSLSYAENWNTDTCPVFVTFWKTSVHRHLLTVFHKKRFSNQLEEAEDERSRNQQASEASIDLETIRHEFEQEILSWRQNADQIPLVLDLLHFRVLALPHELKSQESIATKHGNLSQAYVCRWERYLHQEIRKRFGEDYKP